MAPATMYPTLNNLGSLITYKDRPTDEKETALGYLLVMKDRGSVFDANFGQVPVSPEHAETHNKLLSAAQIDGLDKCQVGECGVFYLSPDCEKLNTFIGEEVSTEVIFARGKRVSEPFRRLGKTFNVKRTSRDHEDMSVLVTRIQ